MSTPAGLDDLPFLLFAASSPADFRYASGFDVEQSLYIRFGPGDDVLVTSELELERARLQSSVARVADRRDLGWNENAAPNAAWAAIAAAELGARNLARVRVAPSLGVADYLALREADLEPVVDSALLVAARRRKDAGEAAEIQAAQEAAEAACRAVVGHLARAEVRDELLWLDGRELTSEWLAARAHAALIELGHLSGEMIIAGSPECALPHFRGAGQLRANAPVIIDIFPRGRRGYHGDLTRTVVVGEVSERVRAMFDACVAAMDVAAAMVRPGVDGRDVHHAVCRTLVERGFGTTTAGFEGDPGGPRMNHSTGHGVGLDVHEAPNLRDREYPLAAGDVITIEPGLYLEGLGGVRVEDTGMVVEGGYRNFTRLPRSLDPADY